MFPFGLPQTLALLCLGEIPQGQNAGAVQGQGGQPPAGSQSPVAGNGGSAGVAGSGSGPSTPPAPVAAPPGIIQATDFYQLDPNDPESRVNGIQLREGFARVRQYDALQGEHHRALNQLQQEQAARQNAENQLRELQERDRLANYMTQMGFAQPGSTPPAPQHQPPGQYQPGAPPAGQQSGLAGVPPGEAADDWMMDFGAQPNADLNNPNGYNNPQGQGTMEYVAPGPQQGAVPQAPGNPAGVDPRQLVSMMSTVMDEKNNAFLNNLKQVLPGMVEQSVGRRFQAQQQQDGVRNQFSSARAQLSDELSQKYGITAERNRDILDKFYLSQANYEEASRLMNQNYQDPQQQTTAQQLADQKLAQANQFFSAAIQDALNSAGQAKQLRQQQEARDMLMTGSYVDLGDLETPNRDLTDPNQIQQMNALNLQKAGEIADMGARLQAAAGAQPATPGLF